MRLPSMRVIYSEPARQAGSFDASLVKIASTELKPIVVCIVLARGSYALVYKVGTSYPMPVC